jgi:hypothetical protein
MWRVFMILAFVLFGAIFVFGNDTIVIAHNHVQVALVLLAGFGIALRIARLLGAPPRRGGG